MHPFRLSALTVFGSCVLLGPALSGCGSADDPPFFQSGGSAGDTDTFSGGRSSGGQNPGAGGESESESGGAASGGGENQVGGNSGSGGESATGGAGSGVGGQAEGSGGSATGGGGSGGATTCDGECQFTWPLRGAVSRDWTVSNYVDRDPSPGILDFRGGDRSYDGHLGVDIAIASFRTMDQGIPIYAVAPGVVTTVHDGEFDRNTIASVDGCNLVSNIVYVLQDDGSEGRYLHFRKDSIVVEVGDEVAAGQKLGEVGSSGCSHSPHLHLELYDEPGGELMDPFDEERWIDPPDYDAPPKVMEVILSAAQFTSVEAVQTAPPSPASVPATYSFGISVISGGTAVGSVEEITFYRDDIYSFTLSPFTFDGTERHYMRWWSVSVVEGPWRADVSLDGEVVETVSFLAE